MFIAVAFAKVPRDYELAVAFQANENVLITDTFIVCFMRELVAFFLQDIRPALIQFQIADGHVAENVFHEAFAAFASKFQECEHRAFFNVAKSCGRANTVTFHETMENHCDLFVRHAHIHIEWPLRWFAEALAALLALPTLNLLLSIKSSFHHLVRQLWHVTFGLAFLRAMGR